MWNMTLISPHTGKVMLGRSWLNGNWLVYRFWWSDTDGGASYIKYGGNHWRYDSPYITKGRGKVEYADGYIGFQWLDGNSNRNRKTNYRFVNFHITILLLGWNTSIRYKKLYAYPLVFDWGRVEISTRIYEKNGRSGKIEDWRNGIVLKSYSVESLDANSYAAWVNIANEIQNQTLFIK